LLLTLPVATEWFLIYCRIGWQLTSNESWNTFGLPICRTLIRPTWKKTFLLSSKICEIIYENVKAPMSQDITTKKKILNRGKVLDTFVSRVELVENRVLIFGASLHIVFSCTYFITWNWLDFLVYRCTSFFLHILYCLKLVRFFCASLHIVFCLHILYYLKPARFFGASLHIAFCLYLLHYLKLARFFGASLDTVFSWKYFIAWNWLDVLVHRWTLVFWLHILYCLKLARLFGASLNIVFLAPTSLLETG